MNYRLNPEQALIQAEERQLAASSSPPCPYELSWAAMDALKAEKGVDAALAHGRAWLRKNNTFSARNKGWKNTRRERSLEAAVFGEAPE